MDKETITSNSLKQIKDRVNNTPFQEFCETVYPKDDPYFDYHEGEYYIKKYRQFSQDFVGYLSYCDNTRFKRVAQLLNRSLYGDDGE